MEGLRSRALTRLLCVAAAVRDQETLKNQMEAGKGIEEAIWCYQ